MQTSRILLTGGSGAVGSPLSAELASLGHEVSIMDLRHAPGPRFHRGDVCEYRQFENVIRAVKPQLVYHLAAEFGRWNGEDFYETMWRTNAIGTKHLLRLAKQYEFRAVIFSSSEVYGDYQGEMTEDVMMHCPSQEVRQLNDYAISKWVNELQALNASAMDGVEIVRVRLFNTYGPGEPYSEYRSVICKFCFHALAGLSFTVYRGHRRTNTYIADCVRALAGIARNFIPGEVYNIASDEEHAIEEVADIVLRVTGADRALAIYRDSEPFTTKTKRVNADKARRDLGMRTTVRLADGIAKTVDWMRTVYPFPAR